MDMPPSRYPVNPDDVVDLELPTGWGGLSSRDVGHMNRIIRGLQHTHASTPGGGGTNTPWVNASLPAVDGTTLPEGLTTQIVFSLVADPQGITTADTDFSVSEFGVYFLSGWVIIDPNGVIVDPLGPEVMELTLADLAVNNDAPPPIPDGTTYTRFTLTASTIAILGPGTYPMVKVERIGSAVGNGFTVHSAGFSLFKLVI